MRIVGGAVGAAFLVVACGAKSTGGGSGGASSGDRGCTLLACDEGATVAFSYREPGRYVVEVVLDGVVTTCTATLPLPRDPGRACDRDGVVLTLVGSALPAEEQSIGGLRVQSTTGKRLEVRVARDGSAIASSVFDPVPWVSSPGPNGPGCEPATCTHASLRLADDAGP